MSTESTKAKKKRHACPACRAVFRQRFPRCPLDGTELRLVDEEPLIGQTLANRYEIQACIGEGGMGQVYLAEHTRMNRRFAIKVLYGDLAADDSMRARFDREAKIASRLDHPNLVSVVDFGDTPEGLLYIAMEFVEGPLLSGLIQREAPLGTDRTMAIFRQLAAGLEHAHDRGMIHRDFKPDNVIVARTNDGELPKILDFGIARLADDSDQSRPLTMKGTMMGTPAFMSPEQAAGERVDARTDLFSLGMTLYEMTTGKLPFDGDPMALLRQNLVLDPPTMSERVPGLEVDHRIEAMATRLIAKSPDERYSSARDVISAIDEWWAPRRVRRVSTPPPGVRATSPAMNPSDLGMEPTITPVELQARIGSGPLDLQALSEAPTVDVGRTTSIEMRAAMIRTPANDVGDRWKKRRRAVLTGVVAGVIAAVAAAWLVLGVGDPSRERASDPAGNEATNVAAAGEATGESADQPVPDEPEGIVAAAKETPTARTSGVSTTPPDDSAPVGEAGANQGEAADDEAARRAAKRAERRAAKRSRKRPRSSTRNTGSATSRNHAGKTAQTTSARSAGAGTPPAPAARQVTQAEFSQKYTSVHGKLEAFRRDFPGDPALPELDQRFSSINSLKAGNPAERQRYHQQLGRIDAKIRAARGEASGESRGQ